MSEADKIIERYKLRANFVATYSILGNNFEYIFNITKEREYSYSKALIQNDFRDCNDLKFLEVGAGNGSNLLFLRNWDLNGKI